VTIKPLEECIHALSSKVEEIKNFLQLPQLKPLKSQISGIQQIIIIFPPQKDLKHNHI